MAADIRPYCKLTQAQKSDVKKRMKPPYVGYFYKISKDGRVHYRQRRPRGRWG